MHLSDHKARIQCMCSRHRDVDQTTGARIDEVRYVTRRVIPSRSGLLQTQKRFCAAIELQILLIGKINLVTQENEIGRASCRERVSSPV